MKIGPIRLIRIYNRANRLLELFDKATASYNKEGSVSKSLFASKTFWFNVITGAVELSGVLPLPPGTATGIAAVGNILLRMFTDRPVHVTQPKY